MQPLLTTPPYTTSTPPGLDESAHALYLSLIGEMPEQYCPPGCTVQANARGAIYVIDHIRRLGFPLSLNSTAAMQDVRSSVPSGRASTLPLTTLRVVATAGGAELSTAPPDTHALAVHFPPTGVASYGAVGLQPSADRVELTAVPPTHKRSRSDSPSASMSAPLGYPPSLPHSGEVLQQPQSQGGDKVTTSVHPAEDEESPPRTPSAASTSVSSALITTKSNAPTVNMLNSNTPISPHRWLEELFTALQMSHRWPTVVPPLFYCHYCHVYFVAAAPDFWQHLSDPAGHRRQRQRIRGFLTSDRGGPLLSNAEERKFRALTTAEFRALPERLFPLEEVFEKGGKSIPMPHFVEPHSLMVTAQRNRIDRDGRPFAKRAGVSENLVVGSEKIVPVELEEKHELAGWHFIMHGLDIVIPYCVECEVAIAWRDFATHERQGAHQGKSRRRESRGK